MEHATPAPSIASDNKRASASNILNRNRKGLGSCVRCADRKVKCNRQEPCSACIKHKVPCFFRSHPPPRRKRKHVNDDAINQRLQRYEALLQQRGVEVNQLSDDSGLEQFPKDCQTGDEVPEHSSQLLTPASTASEPRKSLTKAQLLHSNQGHSKFVDNGLWTRVIEELQDPEDALETQLYDTSDAEASEDDFDYVMGVVSTPLSHSHPHTEHIKQLWQIFIDNVDPLTKAVHVPSLRPVIQKAVADIKAIPKTLEALMFAIYSAAVMSLKNEESKRRFNEPRKVLLSRYISATKVALTRAKFMGSTSIVVLQALIIHILSVRDIYEPRTLWTLTGVAVRTAEAMGLQHEGKSLGLPPFEAEMRRRIWWLLKMNDCRTAELCGLPKFRDFGPGINPPGLPANIDDEKLFPGMTVFPAEPTNATDMIFCALKSELGIIMTHYAKKNRNRETSDGIWGAYSVGSGMRDQEKLIDEVAEILETKYLRYCDPSQPLQLMTMLQARSALNVGRFVIHHPRRWVRQDETPESERQYVWKISIELLQQYDMMLSSRELQRFAWHAGFYLPWHAFIHILDTLQANPLMPEAVKAWHLIESIYQNNPDMMLNTRKPVYVATGNLCLKAFVAHEHASVNEGKSDGPVPEYILILRQQREAAKAKKKARDAKKNEVPQSPVRFDQNSTALLSNQNKSHEPEQTIFDQTSDLNRSDTFWSTSGFGDDLFGMSNDVMNFDPDFMLTQDYSRVDGAVVQSIPWVEWDALLGDLNATRVGDLDMDFASGSL